MLHRIAEYVDARSVPYAPGYSRKSARFAIACSAQGEFLGVDKLGTDRKGRDFASAPHFKFAEIRSGKGYKAQFLLDGADVIALLSDDPDVRVRAKHDYFWKMMKLAAGEIAQLSPLAMLSYNQTLQKIKVQLRVAGAKATDPVTFKIGNSFVPEMKSWHSWWERWRSQEAADQQARSNCGKSIRHCGKRMVSFLSAEVVAAAVTHPNFRGLPEGQSAGTSLVSFNHRAFESYGLRQSENAAFSEEEATKYVAGLDHLVQNQSGYLAGARVIYWYKDQVAPADDPIGTCLFEWDDAEAQERVALAGFRSMLEAVRNGKRPDLARNRYYVLTASGANARAMIRDWHEGEFNELAEHIGEWFDDLEIATPYGTLPEVAPSLGHLMECLLRPKKRTQDREDWIRPIKAVRPALWAAALEGAAVPFAAIARIVTEHRDFTLTGGCDPLLQHKKHDQDNGMWLLWNRMALVKAYHARKSGTKGDSMSPFYDPNHPGAAYHCGALMAVLANAQRAALKDVGAGVIQRYYAAASATPGLVFGRLIRNTQFHLDKLDVRLAHWFTQQIAAISKSIGTEFPSVLSLEEQSLFALGFYQRIATPNKKEHREETENS